MNHMQTLTSAAGAAIAAASLAMVMSTSTYAACKTTLRGELVQGENAIRVFLHGPFFPRFLYFSLSEPAQNNGASERKHFQSLVVENTRTTLPIPFALEVDSLRDCPGELELHVSSNRPRTPSTFTMGGELEVLRGRKLIRLDNFETIPVGANF